MVLKDSDYLVQMNAQQPSVSIIHGNNKYQIGFFSLFNNRIENEIAAQMEVALRRGRRDQAGQLSVLPRLLGLVIISMTPVLEFASLCMWRTQWVSTKDKSTGWGWGFSPEGLRPGW